VYALTFEPSSSQRLHCTCRPYELWHSESHVITCHTISLALEIASHLHVVHHPCQRCISRQNAGKQALAHGERGGVSGSWRRLHSRDSSLQLMTPRVAFGGWSAFRCSLSSSTAAARCCQPHPTHPPPPAVLPVPMMRSPAVCKVTPENQYQKRHSLRIPNTLCCH
jgi:hypothetical protein